MLPTKEQDVTTPAPAGSDSPIQHDCPTVLSTASRYRTSELPPLMVTGAYDHHTSSTQAGGLHQEQPVHDRQTPRFHNYPYERERANNIPLDSDYQSTHRPSSDIMQWALGDAVDLNALSLESGSFPNDQYLNTLSAPRQRAPGEPSSLANPPNEVPFHGPASPNPLGSRSPETAPPPLAPEREADYGPEAREYGPPRRRKAERMEDYDPNDPTQVAPDAFPTRSAVRIKGYLFGRRTWLQNVILDSGSPVSVIDARLVSGFDKWHDVFSCKPKGFCGKFGGMATLDRQIDYIFSVQTSKGFKDINVRAYVEPIMSPWVDLPIIGTSDMDRNEIGYSFPETRVIIGEGEGAGTLPIDFERVDVYNN